MKQKSGPDKAPAEQVLKNIRRQTRRQYSAEEKIRIVLEGLRGEENISELCRREGSAASMYYGWSKEFLEAGKRRLAGDTARAAISGEVKDLRRETAALKEVVADLTLENRLLKKSMNGDGEDEARDIPRPRRPRSSSWSSSRIFRPSARWTNSASPAPRWYDRYREGGIDALADHRSRPNRVWNRIPNDVRGQIIDLALELPELSPRELAVRFTDERKYFVSEASVYRLLKAHDLITSPAYVVIKAANEFKDKTTAINQLWQTDFTYLKITGWGWYYLSTVLLALHRRLEAWSHHVFL